MERFCKSCPVDKDKFCFGIEANEIANDKLLKPVGKHIKIAEFRKQARENGCRKINDIDPGYPGKNLL